MTLFLYISPFLLLLLMSDCYQIQEKQFTVWQGYRLNNTVILEQSVEVKNMINCASKCQRSPHCKAVSYNELSKSCEFHGTGHSTVVITNITDKNQYLAIPKDIPTTTNFAEAEEFETTEDKFPSTTQSTASETTPFVSQQKNWTILGADDCYLTTSMEYSGTISHTFSGISCQYWNTDTPHTRQYLPLDTTSHDTNYCRETNHYEGGPGCYTSDPNVQWEYCYIVKCDACGVDERLPDVPNGTTSHFHAGKFIGMMFTCNTLTSGTSKDHCPVVQCGSDDQWTTGYSVSCTGTYVMSQCGSDDQWTTGYSTSCTDEDCYTDSTAYQGKVTCSAAGIPCKVWSSHSGQAPSGSDRDTNYCRDPDNTGAPWCYTTDPDVTWDYCPVPKC